jgi:hypothetical protein
MLVVTSHAVNIHRKTPQKSVHQDMMKNTFRYIPRHRTASVGLHVHVGGLTGRGQLSSFSIGCASERIHITESDL